ncbi:RusA family crossover junction endodeoxyribonuclease [Streptomyces sp. NPDC056708]|uniref:RusA family crossover junction endodeoxyribonuclease n=1 Tax=unclassified Streptomyces TaxID=2593676 RepID=UPI0036AB97E6
MTAGWTVVRVLAVSEGQQLDCCDEDTAHVWVRVMAWSPRRAFLTGASPFAEAAGVPAAALAGRVFLAELDLDAVPENDDTSGERLEWPGLRLAPEIPEQWMSGAEEPDPAPVELAEPEPVLTVSVYGLPAPQGSKKHIGHGRMLESSIHVKPWREAVVWAMRQEIIRHRGWTALTGPLEASMVFSFDRPKSHYGTGRNAGVLKASAPPRPALPPDLSKLARSTEDAITTAGGYKDDALLVGYRRLEKRYTTDHGQVPDVLDAQGAVIHLYRVGGDA